MKDYYDAVPPEYEPKMKVCPECHGIGSAYVPKVVPCPMCDGDGEVPMTLSDYLSELDYQKDAKLDDDMFSRRRA
jgi:RecJ-like exonuclease